MTRLKNATSYTRVTSKDMLSKVKEIVDEEVKRTNVFDVTSENDIPAFQRRELGLGHVVGRGGFCVVRDLESIQLLMGDIADDEEVSLASRSSGLGSLVSNFRLPARRQSGAGIKAGKSIHLPETGGDVHTRQSLARAVRNKRRGKYVVKQVEPTLLEKDKVSMLKGTIDLALEAKFLASLSHPHVITLQGVSAVNYDKEIGYFIILEKLNDVLSKRLNAWMQLHRATRGITGFVTGGKKRAANLLCDRLLVAYDIADAMSYLHSKRIVYRDLKPDNIGFNNDDVVKLFDFGLAKELSEEDKTENGLYRMTGLTGAMRYMAPEVGLNQPYDLKADVYSWSMVLWYILALEPPMGLYTHNMFLERVFKKGTRPAINQKWSKGLAHLLQCCWSNDIDVRPSFKEICSILREEVSRIDPNSQFDSDDLPRDSMTVTTVESGK